MAVDAWAVTPGAMSSADGGSGVVAGVIGGAVNGRVSFWYAEGGLPVPREPLVGDSTADVVIVGVGIPGCGPLTT